MLEIVYLVALLATFIFMGVLVFIDSKVSRRFGGHFLFAITASLVVFSLCFQPDSFIRWDLIEHFKLVDNMRYGGIVYATLESQYAGLYVYNSFAYLISLLPQEFQSFLTAIPLAIDFLIVGYIYKDVFDRHFTEASGKTRILAVMMWLFTFGIKMAISGIRCSLAVSIAVLAIYFEMIQKRKRLLSVLLYIIAVFIHNFTLLIIIVRLLCFVKKPFVVVLISLGISSSVRPLANYLLETVDNEYLEFTFDRVLATLEEMGFTNAVESYDTVSLIIYVCSIAISVYLFIISLQARKIYKEDGYYKSVVNFAVTVGAVAIGLAFNYLYIQRFMYLVSFALLMVIPIRNRDGIKIENLGLVPVSVFVFFFNDIYLFMVNYIGSYFLAS